MLQLGILAVLALLALALGLLSLRHIRSAAAGVLLFGVVGGLAATSRPDSAGFTDALPSLAGAAAGAATLFLLVSRLTAGRSEPREPGAGDEPGWDRRGFVITAVAAAAASTGAGTLGRHLNGSTARDAVASRKDVVLPAPGSPAPATPKGAGLRIRGISPFITPTDDFYRVDTALVVPKVDVTAWRLRIHGLGVGKAVSLSYDDLLRRDLIERDITLTCVSNEVGGPYVGNARWIGVPLAALLAECGVRAPSEEDPPTSWSPARSTA